MSNLSRRDALLLLGAPACGVPQLPGAKPVWDLQNAFREATPTRERICINGLWRWQPAERGADAPPESGWGYLRVPESWPGGSQRWTGPAVFFANPAWG